MKKSTGVILVLIIVLLLGVIGVGGYFFIKKVNDDTSKQIEELKNEIANISKNVNANANQSNGSDQVPESTTTNMTKEQALKIATDTYKNAYHAIYNDSKGKEAFVYGNYKLKNGKSCVYKMNKTILKEYFTDNAISRMASNSYYTEEDGEYYLIDAFVDFVPGIFGTTDQGIRPLTIISFSNEKINATGQITQGEYDHDENPLKIEFIKVGEKWLVNDFNN